MSAVNSGKLLLLCGASCLPLHKSVAQSEHEVADSIRARRVDSLLTPFDRSDAPGVSIGVFRAGAIVYERAVGMADLEHHVHLTPASVFEIASMSKQFTAMAVVLLDLRGQLSLNDDVRKYIPEVRTGGQRMTVRQLLNHTSGIRDYLDLMDLAAENPDERNVTQADVVDIIASQTRLNFEPGTAFSYENSSYALMATLVQRITGKSLRQFVRDAIVGPLGMRSTAFHDNHTDIIEDAACGYEPRDSGWSAMQPKSDEIGDGGVWTTVEDLAKWDANFYRPTVGGDSGLALLLQPAVLKNGRRVDYALGLFIDRYHGFRMISHGGVDPGYRAQMLRFPDERLTVTVLANNSEADVEGLVRRIADVYMPSQAVAIPVIASRAPPDTGRWTRFVGRYLDERTGRERMIVSSPGGLALVSAGRQRTLLHLAGGDFLDPTDSARVTFAQEERRRTTMFLDVNGQMPSTSWRLPRVVEPVKADEYTGAYRASELGIEWRVETIGSTLVLRRPRSADPMLASPSTTDTLREVARDEFEAEPGLIRFVRNRRGRTVALTVTNVRDAGLMFARVGG